MLPKGIHKAKSFKYFKERVQNYFAEHGIEVPKGGVLDIAFEINCALPMVFDQYQTAFAVVKAEIFANAEKEGKPIDTVEEAMEQTCAYYKNLIDSINQQLGEANEKLRNKESKVRRLTTQLKEFVGVNKQKQELQLREEMFKVGSQSVEAVLHNGIAKLKRKYNFNTWANQVWKYGKATGIKINYENDYEQVKNPVKLGMKVYNEIDLPPQPRKQNLPPNEGEQLIYVFD